MVYKLSVCAIFKNESHIMKEWIEHYIYHGVEHFYLLNDERDDDYLSILNNYKHLITLINVTCDRYLGRQKDILNTYMLPLLNETKWLLIIDLDEFLWSPKDININNVLSNMNELAVI